MSKTNSQHSIEAIRLLKENNAAIAIVSEKGSVTSNERGIKFLLGLVDGGDDILDNACVADKVVGRAAAFLFVAGGAKYVYAEVLSKPAREVLMRYGVEYGYGVITDGIINRTGDGPCPMESAVLDVDDPTDALRVLKAKVGRG